MPIKEISLVTVYIVFRVIRRIWEALVIYHFMVTVMCSVTCLCCWEGKAGRMTLRKAFSVRLCSWPVQFNASIVRFFCRCMINSTWNSGWVFTYQVTDYRKDHKMTNMLVYSCFFILFYFYEQFFDAIADIVNKSCFSLYFSLTDILAKNKNKNIF